MPPRLRRPRAAARRTARPGGPRARRLPSAVSVELPIATLKAILGQQQTKTQREALLLCSALADRRGAAAIFPLLPSSTAPSSPTATPRAAQCTSSYSSPSAQLDEPPPPHAANGNGHGAAHGAAHGDDDWVMVESEREREEAAAIVRAGLLRGLSDKDDELREKMVAHWHARLPKKLGERLVACFEDLHAAEAEARWLHHSAVLLFCLSLDSKNYSSAALLKQLKDGLRLTEHHVAPFDASGSYAMVPGAPQSQSQGGASQSWAAPSTDCSRRKRGSSLRRRRKAAPSSRAPTRRRRRTSSAAPRRAPAAAVAAGGGWRPRRRAGGAALQRGFAPESQGGAVAGRRFRPGGWGRRRRRRRAARGSGVRARRAAAVARRW